MTLPDELLTLTEAAALLGYAATPRGEFNAVNRVSNLISRGVLTGYGEPVPGRQRVSRSEVLALRERRRRRVQAQLERLA